jgi:hypothetical protein
MNHTFLAVATVVCAWIAAGQTTNSIPAGYDVWPFDAKEAARRQTETSKANQWPVRLSVMLETRGGSAFANWHLIPPGKFMMGSPAK